MKSKPNSSYTAPSHHKILEQAIHAAMVNPCSSLEPQIFWENPQRSTIDESKLVHQTWNHSRFQSKAAQAEITEIDRIITAWMHSINPMQKTRAYWLSIVLTAALQSSTSAQKSAQKFHSNASTQDSSSRDHWDRQNHHSLNAQHKSKCHRKQGPNG